MAVLQATTITGGLTMHGMAAGFMKINAEGAVVMDTNTYLSSGSFLPLSGGTMSGKILAVSVGTGTYDGAIELRETGYASSGQSAWGYSPAITFHWGNRYAKRFGMRADGLFAVDDEPLALRSWVSSQGYVTGGPYLSLSGGNVTGRVEFQYAVDRYSQAWRNNSSGAYWWVTTDSDKLGYHRNGDGDKFYFSNGGDFWSSTNGWLSTALSGKLSSDNDSEQQVGLRYLYWNEGSRRMNTDPRWNESGYDADLGCLHIWAWTAAGVAYGRAGIALYNGSAYQYLTTKASTTGMFINNTQIVTNSGTWNISITGNAATLGGYGPNQTGGANTIVQRDANGYIQNSYFYSSGGGSERNGSGLGYIAGFNSSDYYIRSYNSTAVASFLGLGSMAYASTANYIYTNSGNFTTAGTGWYRVATTGSDGRGTYYVEVYTTGGNHNPSYLKILAHGDWGNDKLVSVETDGGFPASSVRITRGASNTFLEVYFTTTILGASLRVNRFGFDSSVQIYTGALPSGGDTQQDIVSVYSKGYHTPGAVFAKTRMLVGGIDDNNGKADLSVDTGGNATIALASQYFRVGGDDVNWGVRIQHNGYFRTYGQLLGLTTSAGNYDISFQPNDTQVAYFNTNGLFLSRPLIRTSAGTGYLSGNYGSSESTATSGVIYTIGGSYVPNANNLGNMYGIGYTYGAVAGLGANSAWGLYVATNGTTKVFLDADSGIGTATGSWRAPIFYDSADTSYYLDPSNFSNLFSATFNSTVNLQATSWFGGYGPGSGPGMGFENQGSFLRMAFWGLDFYDWNHGRQMLIDGNYIYVDNYLQAGNSLRAPIFYDSNDTTYYLDPNAATSLNIAGKITTAVSNGTILSHGSMTDAIGYNNSYGTYIGSVVGGTYYIYANGQMYNNGPIVTLLHSSNYTSWAQQKVYQGQSSGNWQNFTNDVGEFRVDEVLDISGGGHSNYPTGVYGYGGVMSWRTNNHSFQLYASHTGDLAYKTQWSNDNYSGWRRILDSSTYPHPANMNQYVRTSDNVEFNQVSIRGGLYVGTWGNSSDIYMTDGDEGTRRIHCNSNRIGFLNQSGNWGAWNDDNGNWGMSLNAYMAGNRFDIQGAEGQISFKDGDNVWTGYVGFTGNLGYLSFPGRNVKINSGYNGTITLETGVSGYNSGVVSIPYGRLTVDNSYIYAGTYVEAGSDMRAPIYYDSANTAYYGDFASTSKLNVLDANSIYTSGGLSTNGGNSLLGVQSPGGASRANGGSTETGAFKITLPSGIPVYGMFKLVIHIYEYGQRGNGYEIHCGGHMYPNYMYNRFQVQYGSSNSPLNVRYGNDGTNGCIWIGDTNTTWSYPQIWVSEFMMGYSNTSWTTWRSGWSISLVTSYGNSGAMDGPYTCDYGYAASAGSASTSSQVTINYNDNSNANYQLLWGSGNNVYGTGGVYVNPADDRVYANYFSSAYYMDVYTSAGSDYLRITDNQVYRPNGGILYLNWSSNANVALTGPSGGNVGVGNNSPSYKMHVSGDIYANGGWLRVSGSSGLYFESYAGGWHMQDSSYMRAYNGKSVHMNGGSVDYVGSLYLESGGQGVHLQPNTGSYGSLQLTGSRGGWHGIRFTGSNVNLMVNTTEVGFHNNASGWQMRWESGTGYVHKGSTGGGTSATILDSSNYTSWAAPRNYLDGLSVGFHVYGDANTYYPILISAHGHFGMHRYSISRGYSDTAPWDPISTGSHKGGLTLTFDWSSDIAWGGNDKSYRIIQFSETYTTMVAGMALPVTGGMLVWLRGGGAGGAFYRLHTPGGLTASATAYMSGYTAANGAFYGIRTDTSNVNSEIRSRFPVRDSGNSDMYVNNNIVLHAGNYNSYSPTLTGGGASGTWGISITGNADTVDGYHASNFLGYNGNSYYQVNTWLQMNGTHGIYWPSYNGAHFYVNTTSSYTQFRLDGSRGGYGGIWDSYSAVHGIMYDGSGNGGVYREANGRWYMYYHLGNDCMGIGTSSTNSSYSIYSNKGHGVYYSGNNAAGFDAIHSGSINGGSTVQGLTLQWQGYGATYVIAYKQGELSPSDMAHVYSVGGFYFKIFDGSTNRFHRWDDNGAVSINSSSQGSYTFNVTGDIYATADVIAFSDARVKEDVRTVENALDKVTKLRGVTYIKKDEENKKRKMGVIAQEVLEVLPEVVHEDNDGYYGVSYGNIVGVLIEAIKEQQKQIDELKQELKNK